MAIFKARLLFKTDSAEGSAGADKGDCDCNYYYSEKVQ